MLMYRLSGMLDVKGYLACLLGAKAGPEFEFKGNYLHVTTHSLHDILVDKLERQAASERCGDGYPLLPFGT
jgi:hypothetical protein